MNQILSSVRMINPLARIRIDRRGIGDRVLKQIVRNCILARRVDRPQSLGKIGATNEPLPSVPRVTDSIAGYEP